MSSERVPKYRKHKASGQAVVTFCGKDFYLGLYDSAASKAEYDRLVAEWLANGRRLRGAKCESSGLTINELIAAYWKHVEEYYRKDGKLSSEAGALKVPLRRLRALYGHTHASDFGPLALKAVRQRMIDEGLVRASVNKHVSRIKSMFKWAAANEMIPASIHHALLTVSGLRSGRTDAREGKQVLPVPEDDIAAIMPYVSRQVWAMVQLQCVTGMRSGEVASMRPCDIDTTGEIWSYRPQTHKTEHHGHERAVSLGPKAQTLIAPFLKREPTDYLFSPREAENARKAIRRARRQTSITPSQERRHLRAVRRKRRKCEPGDRYTTDTYRQAIGRACKSAGVPHWHPHQLRHNFATEVRKEFGLEAARAALGHRSAVVTEVYAERDQGVAREIASQVG